MNYIENLKKLSVLKKICLGMVLLYLFTAFAAPFLMPYEVTDFSHPSLLAPCREHLLGTDEMGHDIFSLLLNGFRLTVLLALVSGFFSTLIGTVLAFLSCFFGRMADEIITSFANLFLIVPELVVIMFVSVLASPTMCNTILAIVFFSWARVYKIIRGKIRDCMGRSKVQYTLLMKGSLIDAAKKSFRISCRRFRYFLYCSATVRSCMKPPCPFSASAIRLRKRGES